MMTALLAGILVGAIGRDLWPSIRRPRDRKPRERDERDHR